MGEVEYRLELVIGIFRMVFLIRIILRGGWRIRLGKGAKVFGE